MINSSKRELTIGKKIIVILLCVLLNVVGRYVSCKLQLPIWLDTIGIGIAVYFLGLSGAILVGLAGGLLAFIGKVGSLAYVVVSIVVALFQAFYRRRGVPDRLPKALRMGFWTGLLSIIIIVPVYMLSAGGKSGNVWGDAFFSMLEWSGMPVLVCSLCGALIVEIADKQITAVLACGIVRLLNKIFFRSKKPKSVKAATVAITFCLLVNGWGCMDLPVQAADTTEKYVSTIYDNTTGLYSSEANAIGETEDGCIWIGSYAGLTRYDGKNFEFITDGGIVSVTAMMTDSKGRLWIGTNGGRVAVYNNGEFEFYNLFDEINMNSVRCFAEAADGTLYIGTTGNICKIDTNNILHILDAEIQYVNSLAGIGELLVGSTNEGELFVMRDDVVTHVYGSEGAGIYYTCVSNTSDKIWAGTSTDELVEVRIVNDKIAIADRMDTTPLSGICAIESDSTGKVWLAADTGCGYLTEQGVVALNIKGFDSSVESIHEDYEGNIWFASSRYGVLKLSRSVFGELFAEAGEEPAVVNTICLYEGAFYCGTDNGLVIIDRENGDIINNRLTELLTDARVRCIKTDSHNNLWICTYSDAGLVKYSSSGGITTFTEKIDGTTSDRFRCVIELADGTIVAGASNGINFIQEGKVVRTLTQADGLQSPQILCLQEAENGTLYAGSDGAGIYIIKNQEIIGHIGREEGLTSQVIMRITPYGEGYFVVSGDSLCYMKDKNVTSLQEFPYYNNYDAVVMGDNLCVLSSAGVYITNAAQLVSGEPIKYKLYNYYDGLMDGLTANSWNYADESGILYFCTNSGVNYFNPDINATDSIEYKFGLSSVMYDGIQVKGQDGVYQIPADAKMITLEGSLRNYLSTNVKLRFFIRELTNQPPVVGHTELENLQISNLEHGSYTICMQVLSDDEKTVVQEKCYILVKEAHVWENAGFRWYLILVSVWLGISIVWMIVDAQMSFEHEKEMEKIKYQAKGEFLTNMSHEFRTPVNTILGMNDIIMQEAPGDRVTECSENIKQASVRLLNLINDVLDYSAIEAGKLEILPERYFLESMLNNVIGFLKDSASQKGIETEFNVEDNLPAKLLGDEGRVKQIIMNLLSNAVKYTEEGQIVFSVGGSVIKDTFYMNLTVADTGIGIREDQVEQIFAEFDRLEFDKDRSVEGCGLGLSITNSLVKQMGGTITLQSVEGSGSVFSVVIPQKIIGSKRIGIYTYVPESESANRIMKFTAPNARILAADDNRMNLSVISGLLKRNGISPDVAFGGEEALGLCEKNKYDLILMDHMMPYPDGIETLHRIREGKGINVSTPIVVLTANAVSGARKRYLDEGFDDYLSKPVDVEKLEAILLRYLPMEMTIEECAEVEKAHTKQEEGTGEKRTEQSDMQEALISKETGLKFCGGSEELYNEILVSYCEEGRKYQKQLEQYLAEENWGDYGIVAHALKSTSLNIGAVTLSEAAKKSELASKAGETEEIKSNHELLQELLEQVLRKIENEMGLQEPDAKEQMGHSEYVQKVTQLLDYVVNYEMTMALDSIEELKENALQDKPEADEMVRSVEAAVNDFNYEEAEQLLRAFLKKFEEE